MRKPAYPFQWPSELLLLLVGTQASGWPIGASLAVMGVCSLAVVAGASLLYLAMHHWGRALLQRYGKLLRIGPQRLARMERWFARRQRLAIIVGRFIPGMRVPTTALAGLSVIPYRVFALSVAVAALLWSLGYFWLGVLLGRQGPRLLALLTTARAVVPTWLLVFGLLMAGGSLGAGLWGWRQMRRARRLVPSAPDK